jgi:hypothetical protein
MFFRLQEDLDFYQINPPAEHTKQKKQEEQVSFIPTKDFLATNNNKTIKRKGNGYAVIRLDKELVVGGSYKWTILLDSIVNSRWITLGVGAINAANYNQIYGISSNNEFYPGNGNGDFSGDWQTGDHICVTYTNSQVTITNKRTNEGHTVNVGVTTSVYPFLDVYSEGLTITLVDFK